MNLSAVKTSPKAAPKPGSWAFAEDFVDESEQSAQARQKARQLGVAPIGRGSASALTFLAKGGAGEDGRRGRHRIGRLWPGAVRRNAAGRRLDQRRH